MQDSFFQEHTLVSFVNHNIACLYLLSSAWREPPRIVDPAQQVVGWARQKARTGSIQAEFHSLRSCKTWRGEAIPAALRTVVGEDPRQQRRQ